MIDYLPIGSVVLTRITGKRLLIFGRIQEDPETHEVFDYIGCQYPEGMQKAEKIWRFNNRDIQMVFSIGFQDNEEFALRREIADTTKKRRE